MAPEWSIRRSTERESLIGTPLLYTGRNTLNFGSWRQVTAAFISAGDARIQADYKYIQIGCMESYTLIDWIENYQWVRWLLPFLPLPLQSAAGRLSARLPPTTRELRFTASGRALFSHLYRRLDANLCSLVMMSIAWRHWLPRTRSAAAAGVNVLIICNIFALASDWIPDSILPFPWFIISRPYRLGDDARLTTVCRVHGA